MRFIFFLPEGTGKFYRNLDAILSDDGYFDNLAVCLGLTLYKRLSNIVIGLAEVISYQQALTLIVTPRLVVMTLVVTVLLGVIAGLGPAWRAARLSPVLSLSKGLP